MKYTIPLRRETNKVPKWKKTNKAIKAVHEYLLKHAKEPVKIHKSVNQAIWARGWKKPPARITVEITDVKTKEASYKIAHLEGIKIEIKAEKKSVIKKIADKVTGKDKKEKVKEELKHKKEPVKTILKAKKKTIQKKPVKKTVRRTPSRKK
ncbi:MAG: hypothetical protein GOU97_01490 [Nanoarchaeota archaeon]|nr:hypothetical protein [Nanoarchaeota archaeon]